MPRKSARAKPGGIPANSEPPGPDPPYHWPVRPRSESVRRHRKERIRCSKAWKPAAAGYLRHPVGSTRWQSPYAGQHVPCGSHPGVSRPCPTSPNSGQFRVRRVLQRQVHHLCRRETPRCPKGLRAMRHDVRSSRACARRCAMNAAPGRAETHRLHPSDPRRLHLFAAYFRD